APVLFIHGLCAGIAHWIKIMDISSSNQVCYFIDLPGFGKSSRPDFSKSFDVVETVIIQFIENWRILHKIETAMKLVGHSFGGYISFLYASKLPKNVSSLILLDPWGIYSPNLDLFHSSKCQNDISLKMRMIRVMTRFISPFSIMRKTGMFGKFLLRNIRNELYIPYKDLVSQDTFFDYIFYSNIGLPTGEKSYKVLQDNVINSKFPLIERTDCFPDMKHINITLCIGTKSVLYKAYQNQNQQLCDAFGENNFRYIEFSDVDHHIHSSDVFIKSFANYLSENA
ncbi:MAG: 1-acylglycerol-3-phosphate O-acyltransferase abhd5, partial [Paramarteilia canceri]